MPTFPTLSQNPNVRDWEDTKASDPTIRSKMDGGYIQTRARFTRIPRKWNLGYTALPQADKDILKSFEESVKVGSDSFDWTNIEDGKTYTVRFLNPIKYKPNKTKLYWDIKFTLEEV